MSKRVFTLFLALILVLGILAGCEQVPAETTKSAETTMPAETQNAGDTIAPAEEEPLNFDSWTLDMAKIAGVDMEGSYVDTLVEEHLNIDWNIIGLDNFTEQFATMIADKDIPALTFRNGYDFGNEYGPLGAFINIYDYLDQMPNVKAMLEDPNWAPEVEKYTYEEGVMYHLPIPQTGYNSVYAFVYRQDIFEEHNLTFPTTQEEFYNLLVKLKELYPDSYPFVMRNMTGGMQSLTLWGYNWGVYAPAGANNALFTLNEDGSYYYSPASDGYKEMVAFLNKLLDEGLMHPSTMTMDNAAWREAFASNTSFVTYDRMNQVGEINNVARALNPDFTVTAAAPIAMGTNGTTASYPLSASNYSFLIANNPDTLENTLKFVNWLYSEEGVAMTNWGKEGESYTVDADGKKTFNKEWLASMGGSLTPLGLSEGGMYGIRDFDAYLSSLDENTSNCIVLASQYATGPSGVGLTYTEDEQEIWDSYREALNSYAMAQLTKFILGERDLSEWDAYVQELKDDYHYNELQKIHEDAYARTAG